MNKMRDTSKHPHDKTLKEHPQNDLEEKLVRVPILGQPNLKEELMLILYSEDFSKNVIGPDEPSEPQLNYFTGFDTFNEFNEKTGWGKYESTVTQRHTLRSFGSDQNAAKASYDNLCSMVESNQVYFVDKGGCKLVTDLSK
jgi:hypothetical protein